MSCEFSILNRIVCVLSYLQEFKGYVFKIMGGCDKQGFPMKQGVLTPGRVRLLLHRGTRFHPIDKIIQLLFFSLIFCVFYLCDLVIVFRYSLF